MSLQYLVKVYGIVYTCKRTTYRPYAPDTYKCKVVVEAKVWNQYTGESINKIRAHYDVAVCYKWFGYYYPAQLEYQYWVHIYNWDTNGWDQVEHDEVYGQWTNTYRDITSNLDDYYYEEPGQYGYTHVYLRIDVQYEHDTQYFLFIDQLNSQLFG